MEDSDSMNVVTEEPVLEKVITGPGLAGRCIMIVICALIVAADISRTISYICKGVSLSQPRLLQRAIRQNASIRRHADRNLLEEAIRRFVPSSNPSYAGMLSAASKIPVSPNSADKGKSVSIPETTIVPEVEVRHVTCVVYDAILMLFFQVYLCTLVLTTLLRHELLVDAAQVATGLIERIKTFNRRTLDIFSSKAFFYFSLVFERIK